MNKRWTHERVEIRCDFPGGNIVVEEIRASAQEPDLLTIRLRQDQRDTPTPWFYWQFEISCSRDAAHTHGQRVEFQFVDGDVLAALGPAVSDDQGLNWRWLGATGHKPASGVGFVDVLAAKPRRYCMCQPYVAQDLQRFLSHHAAIEQTVLCTTVAGREVELLRVGGNLPLARRQNQPWVLVTARHHACESPGSFVLEGMLEYWESQHVQQGDGRQPMLLAIPFVDKDGVESGDQGKDRNRHDHNRDYVPGHRYAETAAVRSLVERYGLPRVMLDLHAPWIRSGMNEQVYLVGSSDATQWEQQKKFMQAFAAIYAGPFDVRAEDVLPFGQDWNTVPSSDTQRMAVSWFADAGTELAALLEIPYARIRERAVTVEELRGIGRALAQVCEQWVRASGPSA